MKQESYIKTSIIVLIFLLSFPDLLSQNTVNSNNDKNTDIVDTNRIYTDYEVDSAPCFPGGTDSLQQFIYNNFYKEIMQIDYQGYNSLCFIVNRDGNIKSNYFAGGYSVKLFDSVFSKLIKKMPKYIPGKIRGIAVKTLICLPFIIGQWR